MSPPLCRNLPSPRRQTNAQRLSTKLVALPGPTLILEESPDFGKRKADATPAPNVLPSTAVRVPQLERYAVSISNIGRSAKRFPPFSQKRSVKRRAPRPEARRLRPRQPLSSLGVASCAPSMGPLRAALRIRNPPWRARDRPRGTKAGRVQERDRVSATRAQVGLRAGASGSGGLSDRMVPTQISACFSGNPSLKSRPVSAKVTRTTVWFRKPFTPYRTGRDDSAAWNAPRGVRSRLTASSGRSRRDRVGGLSSRSAAASGVGAV